MDDAAEETHTTVTAGVGTTTARTTADRMVNRSDDDDLLRSSCTISILVGLFYTSNTRSGQDLGGQESNQLPVAES